MTQLGDFLREQCGNPDPWNCSTMPADWCIALGHPDFAAKWRDTIEPSACSAAQQGDGGLEALWVAGIDGSIPEVEELQAGDIAVVALDDEQAGAIFTGERWAIRGQRTVHFLPMDALTCIRAWRP